MEKVDDLVDRAKHLVLHEPPESLSYTVGKFHPSLDDHIQKIYKSVHEYAPTTSYFLKEIQHDRTLEDSPEPVDALASLDAFREYMKDGNSSAMGPEKALDLSAPLSDYFISSSHNTYLTGNQLYSDAASSAYTSVSSCFAEWSYHLRPWMLDSRALGLTHARTGPPPRLQVRRD
jgi:hypothetical protein